MVYFGGHGVLIARGRGEHGYICGVADIGNVCGAGNTDAGAARACKIIVAVVVEHKGIGGGAKIVFEGGNK